MTLLTTYWRQLLDRFDGDSENDDEGASLVEYALLVALIAIVCIIAITFLGNSASSKFSHIGSGVANA